MNIKGLLALVIIATPMICIAKNTSTGKATYEFDMFSLISFGLAIAALVLSIFMAWLSWQFYVKSTQAADKTNETVTKIETLVAGVQTNITEIVQRAVGYWIESGGGDGQVTESKREVYEKLNELEQSIQKAGAGAGTGDNTHLLQEVSALKAQIDELGRGIRESQIKTLFPNIGTEIQTMRYSQETTSSDATEQTGLVRVTVMRPTKIATATIKFNPTFESAPALTTNLISSPYEDSSLISAKAGTPSQRGCNLHLNSNSPLKVGEYIFEFIAKAR